MQIAYILGTRPEIIKLAPLIQASIHDEIPFTIIHTDQHYDNQMGGVFFEELDLPRPSCHLRIGSCSHGEQIGRMLAGIERVLLTQRPTTVVVQGDTNSSLAGGLAASKLGIPVAHVEAGLRSHDRTMPEEINRILIDHLSEHLFCPTALQRSYLEMEGILPSRIHITGNTIVDAALSHVEKALRRSVLPSRLGLNSRKYGLLTCHRPSNTDDPKHFCSLMKTVASIADDSDFDLIFPVHPRLGEMQRHAAQSHARIRLIEPVGYLDMLALLHGASLILTDSGGIQEEACILQRKCLVLRLNTERPEVLESGGCILPASLEPDRLRAAAQDLLQRAVSWGNPFGDGLAHRHILNVLTK